MNRRQLRLYRERKRRISIGLAILLAVLSIISMIAGIYFIWHSWVIFYQLLVHR